MPSDALSHITHPLTPPQKLNPQITDATNAIILKMMAFQSIDRYQSVNELANAIENKEENTNSFTSDSMMIIETTEPNILNSDITALDNFEEKLLEANEYFNKSMYTLSLQKYHYLASIKPNHPIIKARISVLESQFDQLKKEKSMKDASNSAIAVILFIIISISISVIVAIFDR